MAIIDNTDREYTGNDQEYINMRYEKEMYSEIEAPDAFTSDMMPPELSNRIHDVTQLMGTPFTAGVPITLTMLGTIIGRKVGLRLTRHSGWTEYPNIWGMLVGGASKGKTPVAKALRSALYKAEIEIFNAHNKEMEKYDLEMNTYAAKQQKAETAKKNFAKDAISEDKLIELLKELPKPPIRPTLERLTVDDATPEALADIMTSRPEGTLLIQDELSALFDKMGAKGREGERQFYLKGWSNETVIIDRIGRGHSMLKDATLGIYGNIQESVLKGAIDEAVIATRADGFLPRFQCVGILSEEKKPHQDRHPDIEAKAAYDNVIKSFILHTHKTLKGTMSGKYDSTPYYSLSDDALRKFNKWGKDNYQKIQNSENDAIESHLAKLPKLIAGIAIIYHIIDIDKQDNIIDKKAHFISGEVMTMVLKMVDALTLHALHLYNTSYRKTVYSEILEDKILGITDRYRMKFPMTASDIGQLIHINNIMPKAGTIKMAIEDSEILSKKLNFKQRRFHLK
ncbi:MAG: hypothetical protein DRG30_05915 [Epsilonproteobacteria bacterium]|nr:MAG: hypothetical protein DRG30_05915 [Campylobacterota bacterium]